MWISCRLDRQTGVGNQRAKDPDQWSTTDEQTGWQQGNQTAGWTLMFFANSNLGWLRETRQWHWWAVLSYYAHWLCLWILPCDLKIVGSICASRHGVTTSNKWITCLLLPLLYSFTVIAKLQFSILRKKAFNDCKHCEVKDNFFFFSDCRVGVIRVTIKVRNHRRPKSISRCCTRSRTWL